VANKFIERAEQRLSTRRLGWPKAVFLTFVGVSIALGLAWGGIKILEYLRGKTVSQKDVDTKETARIPSPSPSAISYNPKSIEGLLSNELYIDKAEGFRIRPPKKWEKVVGGEGGEAVSFLGEWYVIDEKYKYRPSVSVQTGLTKGHLLDGYQQYYMADLKEKLSEFTILEERKLSLAGRDVYFAKIGFRQEEIKITGEILLMLNIDTAFVVTGLDSESGWKKTGEIIENSLYTFGLL